MGNLFGRRTVSPTLKRLGLPPSGTHDSQHHHPARPTHSPLHPPQPQPSQSYLEPSLFSPPSLSTDSLARQSSSAANRERAEKEREQLETTDAHLVVRALLDCCAAEVGRWEDAGKVEALTRALTRKVSHAANFYDLFPPIDSDRATSSSASSTSSKSTFVLSQPDDLIPALLRILCTLLITTSPLFVRLAGFDLLSTYLSSPKDLFPSNDIPPADLGSFLKLVVDRRESGLEDIEARVRCLRALVEGGGGTWDGWGEWSEVVGTLKSWQEDLQRAWEVEIATDVSVLETLPLGTVSTASFADFQSTWL